MRSPLTRLGAPLAVAGALLLALTGCGSGSDAAGTDDAGTAATGGSSTVLRVGDQNQGLELPLRLSGEDRNLPYKLAFNTFEGGPLMTEAFAAGDLDVGSMGDTPTVFAAAAKLDLVVIGVEQNNGNRYTVLAPPGSKIRSVDDLLGKKIAYTRGTAGQGFALRLLHSIGKTEDDIEHVDVPLKDVGPALESGRVDAALVSDPQRSNYLAAHPDAVQVVESKTLGPGYTFLLATRDAVQDSDKRATLEDLVGRLGRATTWRADHADEWTSAYYEQLFKQPADIAKAAYERSGAGTYTQVTPAIEAKQQELADLFDKAGELPAAADVASQFDTGLLTTFNQALSAAE